MKSIEELTGLYSLSKTLRFELKPIGKTLEQIERKGLLTQDEQRSEEYERMKIIIDDYHKRFIAMCLRNCKLKVENIDNYSVAQYEWFFAVYASSGKKWNRGKYHPGGTMWSYADSDTLNLSIARDYCARTYWGTEE